MSGSRWVVTGATGALGTAVVRALLERGDWVGAPYRDAARFAELRAAAGTAERLDGVETDLGDAAAAKAFFEEAVRRLGRLDGVAALAGAYAGSGRLEEAPLAEWDAMQSANLRSADLTCRAALPHLGRGTGVVTVAAKLAETGAAGAAAYAVSKAGVLALTRSLALENRERGVRFNCIAPGILDTEGNRRAMPDADRSSWTSTAAVARVVAFLLSPESAPLNGALVPVDAPA